MNEDAQHGVPPPIHMNPVTVLITSAGTASAVSVIKALKRQRDLPVRIVALDADKTAAGLRLADESAIIPRVSDPTYIPTLHDLCRQHDAMVLIPIYSKEMEVVSTNAADFADAGVKTLLSRPEVIQLANDKYAMAEFVRSIGVEAPEFVPNSSWPGFPVIGKRNRSSGSEGLCFIENERDWEYWTEKYPDYLFQRFVKGTEYTVDVLCNCQSECLACSPRSRLLVKAGQSVKGRTERKPEIEELTRKICCEAKTVGPVNLQFIQSPDGLYFIELNPRLAAGGLMLTVMAGANIPAMLVRLALGEHVEPVTCREDVLMVRYWEELFLNL